MFLICTYSGALLLIRCLSGTMAEERYDDTLKVEARKIFGLVTDDQLDMVCNLFAYGGIRSGKQLIEDLQSSEPFPYTDLEDVFDPDYRRAAGHAYRKHIIKVKGGCS